MCDTCTTTARDATAAGLAVSYQVSGMTCGHCKTAVANEVGKISGVLGVDVDVAGGRVTVSSAAPIDDTVLAVAVDEAGYRLEGRG